jgi:hypothetical protein
LPPCATVAPPPPSPKLRRAGHRSPIPCRPPIPQVHLRHSRPLPLPQGCVAPAVAPPSPRGPPLPYPSAGCHSSIPTPAPLLTSPCATAARVSPALAGYSRVTHAATCSGGPRMLRGALNQHRAPWEGTDLSATNPNGGSHGRGRAHRIRGRWLHLCFPPVVGCPHQDAPLFLLASRPVPICPCLLCGRRRASSLEESNPSAASPFSAGGERHV